MAQFPHLELRVFRALKVSSSKAFKLLNSKEGSTEGRLADLIKSKLATQEKEALDRCRELFGELAMINWGGLWRKRIRANPSKVERILNALELDLREGRQIANPGGFAHDLWQRFAD